MFKYIQKSMIIYKKKIKLWKKNKNQEKNIVMGLILTNQL